MIFLEKIPEKIPQNEQAQLNIRLAEIYRQLSKSQDLGDLVMYNPEVDTNINVVFLAWYQMRLNVLKEELDQITAVVMGE